MKQALVFEAPRTGYSIKQIEENAITIGDLKEMLEDFDDETLFILSHDNGYTYGSVAWCLPAYAEEDGEWIIED